MQGYLSFAAAAVTGAWALGCCSPSCAPSTRAGDVAAIAQQTATLAIEGMTCASCSVTVRMVLKDLDGVGEVTIRDARARVAYDPVKVGPPQMVAAIEKAGYKATIVDKQKG